MNKEFNFEFPTIYREFLSQIEKEGEFLIERIQGLCCIQR